MKPFIRAIKVAITLDCIYEEMTQLQAKNVSFFQFWGHNVPINSSKLLGVRKRNEALVHSFT